MPVYMRKSDVFTPPSLDNVSSEDDDDYLQDPELMRDILPQPYRMINKLVELVLDTVWDVLSIKERYRLAQECKIRPPRYDCAVDVQPIFSKVGEMTDSVDGRYVFVSLPNSLTVMDALTQRPIATWEEDKLDITQMKAHIIGVQTYLIVTVDDMGVARLFAFAFDNLFLLKILNEPEAGSKFLATKCEASVEGDYTGIVLENPSTKETWLDIYKLPRDAWLRELEAIESQIVAKQLEKKEEEANRQDDTADGTHPDAATQDPMVQTKQEAPPSETSPRSQNTESSDKQEKKKHKQKKTKGIAETPPPKAGSPIPVMQTTGDKVVYKFSGPTLVLKIRPPPSITGCSSSLTSACQRVDQGEVIGTGLNHIVTSQHVAQRDKMFNHLHENIVQYMPPRDPLAADDIVMPNFHFLTPGRMILQGIENSIQPAHPTTMCLWWDGGSHIMHFSLIKTAKEIEHKPDMVWPLSCKIMCSAASLCDTFFAVGLENGTVSMWDRYMGIDIGVVSVSTKSSIQCLKFLDPSICPDENPSYPPYNIRNSSCVLIQCKDGSQYLHHTTAGSTVPPFCIAEPPENDDEHETILQTMPDVPQILLVVEKNGNLLLKDVTNGTKLCQLNLPLMYKLASPWQPVVAFGGGGQLMYVKGQMEYFECDAEEGEKEETAGQGVDAAKEEEAKEEDTKEAKDTKQGKDAKKGKGIKKRNYAKKDKPAKSKFGKKGKDSKESLDSKEGKDAIEGKDSYEGKDLKESEDAKEGEDAEECDVVEEFEPLPIILSQMFFFQLRSFPTLDGYWKREKQPVVLKVPATVENRLEVLMADRLMQQVLRKPRMQMRWKMLRQELDLINQRRDVANKSLSQTFYVFESISAITDTV